MAGNSHASRDATDPGTVSFAHPIGTRDGTLAKDAKMVNAFAERSENGLAIVKRPGYTLQRQYAASAAQAQFNIGTDVWTLLNNTAHRFSDGVSWTLPSAGDTSDRFQSLDNYTSGSTFLKSPHGAWVVNAAGGTKVTNANYPALTCPGVAELDGTYYVMDASDGTIHGSAVQDPTSWGALNFVGPNKSMGAGVAIVRHLNYILGLYDLGMQMFYDAQNPTGSPMAPVENASWLTGCASAGSVVNFADSTFFISKTTAKGRTVTMISGLQPTIIGDVYVNRVLNRDTLVGVRAFGMEMGGHSLYVLTLPASAVTLVYDSVYQMWSLFSSVVGGVEGAFVGCNYATDGTLDLLQDASTGAVYSVDVDAYTDAGSPLRVTARTPCRDWGTLKRKLLPSLYLIADTIDTTVTVAYTDDDYQSFSVPRKVDLSTARKMLQKCGSSRRRAWELVHEDATPLRVFGAELEPVLGAG